MNYFCFLHFIPFSPPCNLTFPKSDPPLTWTCYCDKNFTTGAGIWYHMKKATCCARGYICLLDLQKFETVHEIEDHLALNYNYTRPNKIELLEKKIKGEFLEEALEVGKSGRRRKKVDYNKDIDISGGKDDVENLEGGEDDEEMNKKMKKIKLQEDSILSDDSDGSFDKKMRKELASQSADGDDEDSDEDSENSIASDIPTPEESEILDQNDINDIMADITSSTPKKNSRIKTEFNSSNLSQKNNNKRKTPKKEFAYTPQPSATGPNQKATDFKNLHRETILDHKNLAAHINQTCTIPTNLWKMPENKKFLNSSFPDKEFKLQKKLSDDEKNISSWPFVFNQDNEQIYEMNGVIEQTSNRFSFFAGHEAIQTLFIEEFLLVVSVTYIDFFEPKKKKESDLTYNFIGRLHFDLSRINQLITEENGPTKEATVCKVPQFYHPEYSTTKNLIFVGYINSEVDVFQIDMINKKFSLLHTIRNDMVEISCFNHNLGQVDAMDISSSNEYLAVSYSISSSIFIYRILDFEVMAIIEEHEKNIKCLSFCPWNDHLIVSGSYDRKLYYHNWMDSPDFPIEFLNQNYQSAVFTSSVWPLMCPGLIVTTENAFAGDKMYGTHLYWIDNGNFEPPSGRPSIIFGPRQTTWKCDYSGFLNCLVVVDEAGCCYLSALPNFRRRWSVLKAIGFRIR